MKPLFVCAWLGLLGGLLKIAGYPGLPVPSSSEAHSQYLARPADPATPSGQLVLFTQSADTHFLRTALPQLRAFAEREQIALIERAASAGVPAEVTATPALFYRTATGNALFGGRYVEFSAIENFVRVNRLRPKSPATDRRTAVLLARRGSQRIVVPLKVTPQQGRFSGTPPDWRAELESAIADRSAFDRVAEVSLWPTDRRYYLDLHPYVAADGTVFLSAAVFSPFNCIEPVWTNFSDPVRGPIASRATLLTQLTDSLTSVIERRSRDYPAGDALTPLPPGTEAFDWAQLPSLPASEVPIAGGPVDLARSTNYTEPRPVATGLPMLQFNFPAPLDRYAGEVRKLTGNVAYDPATRQLSGTFVAQVNTLTMGMADLDAKVLKNYLLARKFPRASFRFQEVKLPPGYDGQQPIELAIPGSFTLLGKEEKIIVRTRLQPLTIDAGRPGLAVDANFELDIADPFGLLGPDGPPELRNRLQFQLTFQLAGTDSGSG